jgi:hypothetical protein
MFTLLPTVLSAVEAEWEYHLDAYYTALDVNINFSKEEVPQAGSDKKEWEIYRDLLLSSPLPRSMVIEASVNPLPLTGVFLKDQAAHFYKEASLTPSANLVQSITTGFEEPAAVSLFFGNMVDFKPHKTHSYAEGRGYMGYLFSAGTQHILDNDLIEDDWWEAEWKIKGDRKFPQQKLQWSFRVGTKFHGNADITDVFYLGLRRSRIDFLDRSWSWLRNSGFQATFNFDTAQARFIQANVTVDKKFPLDKKRWVPTLSVGFVARSRDKYSGELRNNNQGNFEMQIQPNLEF